MINKILIPTDGSANSLTAQDFGIYIARKLASALTGLYVISISASRGNTLASIVERAGGSFGKKSAYISLTAGKSFMFFKKIVVLTMLDMSKSVFFNSVCIFMRICRVAFLMSLIISPVAGSTGN